jgi:glycosyltransferase involved in cell wall biosynthesis
MEIVTDTTYHIGLGAHLLNLSGTYRSAGISWYIYHLVRNLEPAPDLRYTFFTSEPRSRGQFQNCTIALSRLPTDRPFVRIFWEQVLQPILLRRDRINLLHALAFAGPRTITIPWISTVYDLSFMRYPQSFNTLNRIYLKWAVRQAVRSADHLVAISASTKRDLIELFCADPGRVSVIYCGKDPSFSPSTDARALAAWQALRRVPERMILFVGTIEPRKNIVRLLRAFARAKRTARLPHQLVLIGARGWKYSEVDSVIADEGISGDVVFAGYVPQDELHFWYQSADLFVYPSLYEGFGMPPLDAMACGTPVITSNVSSLPEVVGNAGIQVPPQSEDALTDAIVLALTNSSQHEQMRERGLNMAAKFSWRQAGQETSALYREVLSRKQGAIHASR